KANASK
ncbi:hypothetical protein JL09_g6844, partial [Pichia kudriavzevii]